MLRRLILIATVTVFLIFQACVGSVSALELERATHPEIFNETGQTIVLSGQEIIKGQQLFDLSCTKCHLQSQMETNSNMIFGLKTLFDAQPPRDNFLAVVDYLKRP